MTEDKKAPEYIVRTIDKFTQAYEGEKKYEELLHDLEAVKNDNLDQHEYIKKVYDVVSKKDYGDKVPEQLVKILKEYLSEYQTPEKNNEKSQEVTYADQTGQSSDYEKMLNELELIKKKYEENQNQYKQKEQELTKKMVDISKIEDEDKKQKEQQDIDELKKALEEMDKEQKKVIEEKEKIEKQNPFISLLIEINKETGEQYHNWSEVINDVYNNTYNINKIGTMIDIIKNTEEKTGRNLSKYITDLEQYVKGEVQLENRPPEKEKTEEDQTISTEEFLKAYNAKTGLGIQNIPQLTAYIESGNIPEEYIKYLTDMKALNLKGTQNKETMNEINDSLRKYYTTKQSTELPPPKEDTEALLSEVEKIEELISLLGSATIDTLGEYVKNLKERIDKYPIEESKTDFIIRAAYETLNRNDLDINERNSLVDENFKVLPSDVILLKYYLDNKQNEYVKNTAKIYSELIKKTPDELVESLYNNQHGFHKIVSETKKNPENNKIFIEAAIKRLDHYNEKSLKDESKSKIPDIKKTLNIYLIYASDMSEKDHELGDLKQILEDSKQELTKKDETIKKLKEENEKIESRCRNLGEAHYQVSEEKRNLEIEYNELFRKEIDLEIKHEALEKDYKKLKKEYKILKKEYKILKEELSEYPELKQKLFDAIECGNFFETLNEMINVNRSYIKEYKNSKFWQPSKRKKYNSLLGTVKKLRFLQKKLIKGDEK